MPYFKSRYIAIWSVYLNHFVLMAKAQMFLQEENVIGLNEMKNTKCRKKLCIHMPKFKTVKTSD